MKYIHKKGPINGPFSFCEMQFFLEVVSNTGTDVMFGRVEALFFAIPDMGVIDTKADIVIGNDFGSQTQFETIELLISGNSACGPVEIGSAVADNTVRVQTPRIILT